MLTDPELDSITKIAREAAGMSARVAAREVIDAVGRGTFVVPEFLNQQNAAAYCGYSEQFFNKVCRAGNGPRHVMVGTRWRTRRLWLEKYMESGGPHGSRNEEGGKSD
jgi:hypothetical protein